MKHFLVPDQKPYVCGHCGFKTMGGRYSDHCPRCLWSQHVDDQIPGDRASACHGLMEPIGVIHKHGRWRLIERCVNRDKTFIVDCLPEDHQDLIISLSQKPVK
jgi:hypothetical protein